LENEERGVKMQMMMEEVSNEKKCQLFVVEV